MPYLTKIAFHQNESLFELIHTFSQVNRILEYLEANLTEIKEFITSEKKLIQKFPSTDQVNRIIKSFGKLKNFIKLPELFRSKLTWKTVYWRRNYFTIRK